MKDELDFIVIGAQHAGTTILFDCLQHHPQIALPKATATPFFSHDAIYTTTDWHGYLRRNFPRARASERWGTVTPDYMFGSVYDPSPSDRYDEQTVPQRIYERLPHVGLIALLRDPVSRARVHHEAAAIAGLEPRSFDEAMDVLLEPRALEAARRFPTATTGYVVLGEYARILAGYAEFFPPTQLLVVFTDDLVRSPAAILERLWDFLRVNPELLPTRLTATVEEVGSVRRLPWLDFRRLEDVAIRSSVARSTWHALPEASRRRVANTFDQVAYRVGRWNRRRETATGDQASPSTLRRLSEHFAEDAVRLCELLGAPPPWRLD